MAKKTTTAETAVKLTGILPKGEAAQIKRAFDTRLANSGATNLPEFPDVACISVTELRAFLDQVEKVVNPNPGKPVPPNEIGVGIMPAFRKNKVTFMLVATRFREDKATQKVIAINNPVTGIHRDTTTVSTAAKAKKSSLMATEGEDDPNEPPVDDLSLDTISTRP